jgi:outer membrane receptor protein involved in Fe transport
MTRKQLVLPIALAIGLSPAALAEIATGGQASSIEEFVVTATRREESLAKVPVSISAYSQARMDAQGIKSIDDIARFTPGLTFAPSSDGLTSSIAIRGVSSGVGASTTGVYIDDTPVQVRSGTGVVTENMYPQVFDLERVEVLRGPQGTLFGTGSMGGTVRFITPEPSLDTYSGYARAEYGVLDGGEPGSEIGASGGGPIVPGKSAFRVSVFYSDAGGYVDREPFDGSGNTDKDIRDRRGHHGEALGLLPAQTQERWLLLGVALGRRQSGLQHRLGPETARH